MIRNVLIVVTFVAMLNFLVKAKIWRYWADCYDRNIESKPTPEAKKLTRFALLKSLKYVILCFISTAVLIGILTA